MKSVMQITFFLIAGIAAAAVVLYILGYDLSSYFAHKTANFNPYQKYTAIKETILKKNVSPMLTPKNKNTKPSPTRMPSKRTVPGNIIVPSPIPSEEWGVAKQIGEHTYTIKLGDDPAMGTPEEILTALNNYRSTHGAGSLQWSDTLSQYSQQRADLFAREKSTDGHAGLNNFLDNEDGFETLGFSRIGENSYFGGPLNGVHLIEWLFASSQGHDANQLEPGWSHVGIATTATSANIIFAGGKF